jgi:hypothetical protein
MSWLCIVDYRVGRNQWLIDDWHSLTISTNVCYVKQKGEHIRDLHTPREGACGY